MTTRLPSLNGLRAFEAAARHLSFTQAASELNVTQTAISHQIRRLEEELGIRLFVRKNRALALTPEASEYLPGIRAAFNDLRLATDRLLRKDDDNVLTISTLASLAAEWLMPDEMFPVCSPALLSGKHPLRHPEDLRDHVLLHNTNNVDDWRLWLTAAGLPPDISKQPGITFDLILMTVQAAIDGMGVAMGRTSYVKDDIANDRLVVPFKIALPADAGFYLVSPEGAPDSPKLRAFRQWLIASAQNKP